MCDFNTRLKHFFSHSGENMSEVERKCGFNPQTLRKSMDRGSNIQVDKVVSILSKYPNLSAEWLLRGEGAMEKNNQNISDIKDSKIFGVNLNGNGIRLECPFSDEDTLPIIEFIKNYQKGVEVFQNQISELITIIKYEQSKCK